MIGKNVYWERLTNEEKKQIEEAGKLVQGTTGLGIVKQVVKGFPELNSRYMNELKKNDQLEERIQELEETLAGFEEKKKQELQKIKNTIEQYFDAKDNLKEFITSE